MQGLIALDVGTTSIRALLYDAEGRIRHLVQRANAPCFYADGRVEQAAESWAQLLPDLLMPCAEVARENDLIIECISVTAQRSSVMPIDQNGRVLFPVIMWQDRRTDALTAAMASEQEFVYHRTGLRISPVYSALKMRWLRENHPDIWKKTYKIIGVQDWVLYQLSGCLATDHTFASRTNLFNLTTREWDDELLALFGVSADFLCELVAPGSIVGGLCSRLAEASALPQGLPIVTAGGDQQCAALGLGLFSSGQAICNTGTGSFLITHSATPVFDPAMRLSCNVSALPGNHYIVEAATQTSGAIYRWFAELLSEHSSINSAVFKRLDYEAAAVPPGANGVIFLPHFKGGGAPYWDADAKGLWYGMSLSTGRGDMARAILEGIAIELHGALESLETLCGTISTITVSGGMSHSDVFNQIQSDVFDRTITRLAHKEATAFGAWLAGAVACGFDESHENAFKRVAINVKNAPSAYHTYHVTPEHQAVYARQRARSRALYQLLTNAHKSLSI